MKILVSQILILSIVLISGCTRKESEKAQFVIPSKTPATALTIGWYVPVNVLDELAGPGYKPKVVKDDSLSMIMLYFIKGDEHYIDGISAGPIACVHVVIPVEKPLDMKVPDKSNIEATMVCPTNIVDESKVLGNRYNEFGFATYFGDVDLDVTQSNGVYFVKANLTTTNGIIGITAKFEEEGEKMEAVSAMINQKPGPLTFFYGEESFTRFSNGKGNLKTGGENIIKAINLSGQPYFLRLDLDLNWAFDFYKEQ